MGTRPLRGILPPCTTSGMAGRPGSDLGDLGVGERHCLGEMAPFVRIFLLLPPAEAGLGISSREPRCDPSLELTSDLEDLKKAVVGGCSPSVPLPSDMAGPDRYTTVSHDSSDEE